MQHSYHIFRGDTSFCGLVKAPKDTEVVCPLDLICRECVEKRQPTRAVQINAWLSMVHPKDPVFMRSE